MSVTRSEPHDTEPKTQVVRLRFEHRREALGIGTGQPRLSWQVNTNTEGWMQTAYELEALTATGTRYGQTGQVASSESVLVDWPFEPLASRERVTVRVRVWGNDGEVSDWGGAAVVETGLLESGDWAAQFVRPDWEEDVSVPQPGPLLRKAFTLRDSIAKARLYVTALGVYEASLNGTTVGDEVMAPGWTSYHHRLRYQTFDVTELLQEGPNVFGAMLGDGWFRGRLGFGGGRPAIYGDRIALLAQLEVEYEDGETERIVT
ncbi:MAG: alpha-L-rhamnosidase N-terminal domain-containing protein, partial [Anaerolineae bacterium]|nr:alpha-L-rhamnosidase N-terminal domain-containing protein [Anaerolineae bacterium]